MKDDPKSNIQFVKTVEAFPVLYDIRLEGYSRKDCQDVAWSGVAAAMKDSVANCKEKWRNIRTCLTRHLRQAKDSMKYVGRTRRPYYLAPYMSFLLPFTKTRIAYETGIPYDGNPDPLPDDSNQLVMVEEDVADCLKPRIVEVKGEATYEMSYPQEVRRACLKEDEAITEEEEEEEGEGEELVIEVGEEDAIEVVEGQMLEEEMKEGGRKKVAEAGDEPKRRRVGEDSSRGEALKVAAGGLNTIRINHFDGRNARISVERSPSPTNADMDFFRSLLPELSGMTMSQKSKFRISVLKSLHELLYES